ncbi:hypothetical protein [Morganella morganii]|uniref:hypothetical protein n=1 Tax=Morganella morganii TaxID=582 RepID=UPI001E3B3450|nr:hypothetical protein [Morganella morganii]UEH05250.1 hypothetical protein LLY23_07100 [Morganella morganii]HCT3121193.1 hypothetical protein [Morganella morganii]
MTSQSGFLMFYGYFLILFLIGAIIYKRSGFLKAIIVCFLLFLISFFIMQYTHSINIEILSSTGRYNEYNPFTMSYLPLPVGFIIAFLLKKKENKNNVNK